MQPADQTLATAVIAETTDCLNSCVGKMKHCLGQLTDEQVWWRLDEVAAAAAEALSKMTAEEMLKTRRIQGFTATGLGAIFRFLPHFKGHTQEIICLTRMQLGDRYKFEWVPKTAEEGAPKA